MPPSSDLTTGSKDPGKRAWIGLLVALAACLGVGVVGGMVTSTSVGTGGPTASLPRVDQLRSRSQRHHLVDESKCLEMGNEALHEYR